ncbi:hypothetical protein N8772_03945 [Rickettsiales bacterium]|nr:hypothetical protein [Rickettsiales bacterium]
MLNKKLCASALLAILASNCAFAVSNSEFQSLKNRILKLEKELDKKEAKFYEGKYSSRKIFGNEFNPSIGIVLNGKFRTFSKNESELKGFGIGHEGERGNENFSLGESELNFASNIDDKFFGSLTAAIVREGGEDKIELEESFIKTRPELGLPTGMEIKIGRSFWNLGYLNEHHAHTDDFSNRPLVYRAFMNRSFNDDGAQISYILPTSFYSEIGGGTFRGNDFPFGNGDGTGSYSAYLRIGGDITDNQNFRIGASILSGESKGSGRANEEGISFIGKSDLYIADLRYNFTPTGNAKQQEIILQGEYFFRDELGTYEAANDSTGRVVFDDNSSGWYVQSIYKFNPNYRIGVRYGELNSPSTPTGLAGSHLDADGFDAKTYTAMLDWTNSEFSRIRVQYDHEELERNNHDNQFTLQYIVSLGAHSAHKY